MADVALSIYTTFKTTTCITCGVVIAMVEEFYNHRVNDQNTYYCPSGHRQNFVAETEEQKLRKQLEAQKRRTDMALAEVKQEQALRTKAEKKLKRTEKRTKSGVCPVPECHRHFTNVERHVATKHPGYAK
jgi:hypothetical protein